jgi:hypothetical protein
VGEIGLDYYLPGLDAARQESLLVEQLKLARKYNLPVLLHVRRAQDRILKYLRQIPCPAVLPMPSMAAGSRPTPSSAGFQAGLWRCHDL